MQRKSDEKTAEFSLDKRLMLLHPSLSLSRLGAFHEKLQDSAAFKKPPASREISGAGEQGPPALATLSTRILGKPQFLTTQLVSSVDFSCLDIAAHPCRFWFPPFP